TAPRRSGEAHRQSRGWPPSKDLPAFGRTETGGPAVAPPPPIPSACPCPAQRARLQLNIPRPLGSTTGLTREPNSALASPTQDCRFGRCADPSEPECSGSGCRPITRTAPSLVCANARPSVRAPDHFPTASLFTLVTRSSERSSSRPGRLRLFTLPPGTAAP